LIDLPAALNISKTREPRACDVWCAIWLDWEDGGRGAQEALIVDPFPTMSRGSWRVRRHQPFQTIKNEEIWVHFSGIYKFSAEGQEPGTKEGNDFGNAGRRVLWGK